MKVKSLCVVVALLVAAVFVAIGCDGGGSTIQKDCVVWIGDSIFDLSGEEANVLEDLSGHSYRTYYASGAQMEGGFVQTVPSQYEEANRDDSNIRTVLMDGGGNDVLIGEPDACSTDYPNGSLGRACYTMMDTVTELMTSFWQDMIDDGVENIVNQGYYYTTDDTQWVVHDIFQDRTIDEWNNVAARNPGVKMIYVDPRENPYFDRDDASRYTIYDGIHPTDAASEELADKLWDAMVANGIEQTDECSSGSGSSSGGCN